MPDKKESYLLELGQIANKNRKKGKRVNATITVDEDLYEEAKKHFKGEIGKIVDLALSQVLEMRKAGKKTG